MYVYDQVDRNLVAERVAQYRDQVRRFLAGDLTEDEFRPLRLQNGLYIQKYAPMLRVAIPYGLVSAAQLRMLAYIARRYDRGYGHFSTRQNIQYNWPRLEDSPDILADLASVEMHAIQTSGNCVRNITSDEFAGIAADEIVDPRPLCEILRQWSTFHPEFSYLPRKFKIAVNGSVEDRSATAFHDIGLYLRRAPDGELGLRVLVGGGMGRTPVVGTVIREFLPWQHMMTYVECILRVYNRYGRRDNIYKARIKILVKALGAEEFARQVEEEWALVKDGPGTLTEEELKRVSAYFTAPAYQPRPQDESELARRIAESRGFARWAGRALHPHRVPGYRAVVLSLKKTGVAPGDATAEQMERVADWSERFGFGEIRVSHEQNLILPDVRAGDLYALGRGAAGRAGHAEPRAAHRHHRLPRRRLLFACQRQVDPYCRGNPAPLRRPGLSARHRRVESQHFRLHELVWPPSRRPHRNPRRRQGRGGVVPGVDRRRRRFRRRARPQRDRQGHRALVQGRRHADVVSRLVEIYLEKREADERFVDTVERLGIAPSRPVCTERRYARKRTW
jgi:sulfite reductase (NADPH) hemoprotein beta-component